MFEFFATAVAFVVVALIVLFVGAIALAGLAFAASIVLFPLGWLVSLIFGED